MVVLYSGLLERSEKLELKEQAVNEHLEEEEKFQKADPKKLKAQAALCKKEFAEKKSVAAAAGKERECV
jgi:hypothetical protein